MYVCLCKGLTDTDVVAIAKILASSGASSVDEFLAFLDLEHIGLCGLCAEEPEHLISLAVNEWNQTKPQRAGGLEERWTDRTEKG